MNLDEFKAHVKTQREASKAEALSVLSAKIIVKKEENKKNGISTIIKATYM